MIYRLLICDEACRLVSGIYLHLVTKYNDGDPTQINLDDVFHEHIEHCLTQEAQLRPQYS